MTAGQQQEPSLSGVVMAGGRSERFGRDKASIEIAGQSLLDRAVALLGDVVDTVYVSVAADQVSDAIRNKHALLIDEQKGIGPMAGLLAAHRCEPGHAWLALACDMPLMDRATLLELIAHRDARRAATTCRSPVDGGPEPLCAIYEPDTLARFSRDVAAGKTVKPRQALVSIDALLMTPANPAAMSNVNRPEDLAQLEPLPANKR